MKIGTKLAIIGVISLVVGSVFASPLLFTELEIVPFWTVPEGPKADFNINVVYANFTIQENASDRVLWGRNMSVLNYYVVFKVTNPSDFPATVSTINFAAAKNITVIPSALGGFFGMHDGGLHSSNFGPSEGYIGHVGAGRVEGVWLDDEWINVTWVPEGGLEEIWKSGADIAPKGLEHIWTSDVYPPFMSASVPFTSYSGTQSNDTMYYTYSGTVFNVEGGNYWIEGVPIKEYISGNEVKSTIMYYNSSWIDVTGRIEIKERPYVITSNTLVSLRTHFSQLYRTEDSVYSGISHSLSDHFSSRTWLPDGFNNTWGAHQSRLILLTGSVDIESWNESFSEGEIIFHTESTNYLNDPTIDGNYVNTYSSATELKIVQLGVMKDQYLYNTLLADDQMFATDSSGVEVFVKSRDQR